MIRWLMGLLLLLILVAGMGPRVLSLSAFPIAEAAGCTLHEGWPNACVVFGIDVGEVLYFMLVIGWVSLVTFPLGVKALAVWLVAALLLYAIHRRRRTAPEGV